MPKRMVAVNENGVRIGEDHPRAKLTDHEVDLIRQLRADGLSYRQIAEKFEVTKRACWLICKGALRSQTTDRWKQVG